MRDCTVPCFRKLLAVFDTPGRFGRFLSALLFCCLVSVAGRADSADEAAGGDDAAPTASEDRHAGYYYPEPASIETYIARADTLPDDSRRRRIGFVTALTAELLQKPYPPDYAMFAKGEDAEKLIIISVQSGRYDTLYRARALLATLSAAARMTSLFRDLKVDDYFTFFDLAKMLGFRQITVSDGDRFAHRVYLR